MASKYVVPVREFESLNAWLIEEIAQLDAEMAGTDDIQFLKGCIYSCSKVHDIVESILKNDVIELSE